MSDSQTSALIDIKQVNNLKELFNEGFGSFLETFYLDFEKKEQDLLNALNNNQMDTVGRIAHSIKGSSLNMGASGLAIICESIEEAINQGNLEKTKEAFTQLHQTYPKIKDEFNKISSIH
ncbi:Hpt domain-containing protein [Candidatus Berkiella aquae]|uniref:Hpt domain protein n=1 Tax=Candidatus Berkiella aquae TaxID=295108 RepID=A0A0Q9YLG2_9GAMM|nr:Hpt domain-containing protein [Candidatus Berkiella aquae]MCS5711419.1 Hpt domain-containing protein [Candidatus Berkiella aquae]